MHEHHFPQKETAARQICHGSTCHVAVNFLHGTWNCASLAVKQSNSEP